MSLAWVNDEEWLAPPRAIRTELDDGCFLLRSPEPLKPYARCVGEWLEHWAATTPDALAFAERNAQGEWVRLSWRDTREQVGKIGQALLNLRMPAGAPVVVLSDNSLEHLLLTLAAMHVGIPACTVSSAYCRLTSTYDKIHGILATLKPGLIYASDAQIYGPAIQSSSQDAVVVYSQAHADHPQALSFSNLLQHPESPEVMAAFKTLRPDSHAKYLLTSGSTGNPKVVINTHRMLCANQQSMAQVWRFLEKEKPVLVDWLPWSHTFGSNHNINIVLRNGGTLVIDEGRPAPGLIDLTLSNMAETQPTLWFNVPKGFDMALPRLEADLELAKKVMGRLRMIFYAGAALPQSTWDRLQALARKVRGEDIWMTTSWGSTETAPAITSAHWKLDRAGNIGNVLPGLELKFIPNGDKLEMRVRGVSIFDAYRDSPLQTIDAFDPEGYYCIGDAGYLADPQRPEQGVIFDGRVAEDFKLTTGTWVSVGTLRVRMVSAMSPWVQDAVITGHDRDEVGLLLFLSAQGQQLPREELRAHLGRTLAQLAQQGGGSSTLPRRALILEDGPSPDGGEITDKGYVNQRAVLTRRADKVAALYAGDAEVILPLQAQPA